MSGLASQGTTTKMVPNVSYSNDIDDEEIFQIVQRIRRRAKLPEIARRQSQKSVFYTLDGEVVEPYQVEIQTDAASIVARSIGDRRDQRKHKRPMESRFAFNEALQQDTLTEFDWVRHVDEDGFPLSPIQESVETQFDATGQGRSKILFETEERTKSPISRQNYSLLCNTKSPSRQKEQSPQPTKTSESVYSEVLFEDEAKSPVTAKTASAPNETPLEAEERTKTPIGLQNYSLLCAASKVSMPKCTTASQEPSSEPLSESQERPSCSAARANSILDCGTAKAPVGGPESPWAPCVTDLNSESVASIRTKANSLLDELFDKDKVFIEDLSRLDQGTEADTIYTEETSPLFHVPPLTPANVPGCTAGVTDLWKKLETAVDNSIAHFEKELNTQYTTDEYDTDTATMPSISFTSTQSSYTTLETHDDSTLSSLSGPPSRRLAVNDSPSRTPPKKSFTLDSDKTPKAGSRHPSQRFAANDDSTTAAKIDSPPQFFTAKCDPPKSGGSQNRRVAFGTTRVLPPRVPINNDSAPDVATPFQRHSSNESATLTTVLGPAPRQAGNATAPARAPSNEVAFRAAALGPALRQFSSAQAGNATPSRFPSDEVATRPTVLEPAPTRRFPSVRTDDSPQRFPSDEFLTRTIEFAPQCFPSTRTSSTTPPRFASKKTQEAEMGPPPAPRRLI